MGAPSVLLCLVSEQLFCLWLEVISKQQLVTAALSGKRGGLEVVQGRFLRLSRRGEAMMSVVDGILDSLIGGFSGCS